MSRIRNEDITESNKFDCKVPKKDIVGVALLSADVRVVLCL